MHDRTTTVGAIDAEALRTWIANVAERHGFPPEDAAIIGAALVDADLRGIATHGVVQFPNYLDLLKRGILNARPTIKIDERGAMLRVDADNGLGHVVGTHVLKIALDVAAREGVAVATMSEIGHLGALGYFTRQAADGGMAALLMQNGPPLMGLPGSRQRAIGNNPLSFAAPVAGRPPVVFDVATSEAAYGKLTQAIAAGEGIPDNWALDAQGNPTRNPRAAADGILLPSGGFKGIGLAMMVDIFAGSLSGTRPVWGQSIFGAFLMVVDPRAAAGREVFDVYIGSLLATYEASSENARYPGARAAESFDRKSRDGIVLGAALKDSFVAIGEAVDVPFTIDGQG